jgi:putative addiction module component (TIGR02574 family)
MLYYDARSFKSMSHKTPFPPPGFDELSIEEQVEYAGDLWDYVTSQPDQVPTPEWHKKILAERLAKYRPGEEDGWKTWEEFEQERDRESSRP